VAEFAGVKTVIGGLLGLRRDEVKPDNAGTLMAVADVDGALVGGASLNARDFCAIANAAVATGR
jgi:triosephosphate isomerase